MVYLFHISNQPFHIIFLIYPFILCHQQLLIDVNISVLNKWYDINILDIQNAHDLPESDVFRPGTCRCVIGLIHIIDHLQSGTALIKSKAGARPTNDISIEFEIRSKLGGL